MLAALVAVLMVPTGVQSQTLPDTTCASAVGIGPNDIPHAYLGWGPGPSADLCPSPGHYSGELGFAIGAVRLFSRAGSGTDPDGTTNQGNGVVDCYDSTDPIANFPSGHHGAHSTIHVKDDFSGSNVGFVVTTDWSRRPANPTGAGPGNNQSTTAPACGDGIVEPCPGNATEAAAFPVPCNQLDRAVQVAPVTGQASNAWTSSQPLGEIAGADGAVVVMLQPGALIGAVWTA